MEIVLEVAVSMLTESYRKPFEKLLNDAPGYLTKDIIKMLDDTLKRYPHFKVSINVNLCVHLRQKSKRSEEWTHIGTTSNPPEDSFGLLGLVGVQKIGF